MTDDSVISTETFTYDAAGNLTDDSNDTTFAYDTNNRLTSYNGTSVLYDMDGNMLSNGSLLCTYDSSNKLHTANGHTYTYNAEDVRIRNLCEDEDTTYTYNTNAKLSMLLMKTTNGVVTKYVYGKGLIGEETNNSFKTYHFDCRGSTIAITDASGNITDTFAYDTYGKCISHTGTTPVIFGYNGRDGVVTDSNGLIYMRARYYSPEMKRFINADVIAGAISNAITLNRFAYANGNPVSFVDPFGLSSTLYAKLTKDEKVKHDLSKQIAAENARKQKLALDEKKFQSNINTKPKISNSLYDKLTLDEKKFQNSIHGNTSDQFAHNNNISFADTSEPNVETEQKTTIQPNYTKALLISNRNVLDGGLPVVGHTQLYFYNDTTGTWYFTEYSGPWKTIFDKTRATVKSYESTPPKWFYLEMNPTMDYVILTGNFNESVEYADEMDEKTLGGYNLFTNNCCDYTNTVLSMAEIDGYLAQGDIQLEAYEEFVSVPVITVKGLEILSQIDYGTRAISKIASKVYDEISSWF